MRKLVGIGLIIVSLVLVACGSDEPQEQPPPAVSYANNAQGIEVKIAERVTFTLKQPPNIIGYAGCGSFTNDSSQNNRVNLSSKFVTSFPKDIIDNAEYCQVVYGQNSRVVIFDPPEETLTSENSDGTVELKGEQLTVDLNTLSGKQLSDTFAGKQVRLTCQYVTPQQQVAVSKDVVWEESKYVTTLPVDLSGVATDCNITPLVGSDVFTTLFSFTGEN